MKNPSGSGSFVEELNQLGNLGGIRGKRVQYTAQHCNQKVKCDGKRFKHLYAKHRTSQVAQWYKVCLHQFRSLGWEDPLEKGIAIYSRNLARKIP